MKKVYVNEKVCIGCHLCEIYCQLHHAQSDDLIKVFKKESPRPVPRLRVEENGVVSLSVRCQHCDDAPCVRACLTGALSRDPDTGVVSVDDERMHTPRDLVHAVRDRLPAPHPAEPGRSLGPSPSGPRR